MEAQNLNAEVKDWNRKNFQSIKDRYMQLIRSPNRSGEGFESLKSLFGYHYGEVDRLSYKFKRYLVFVHKGVGKGRPIGSGRERPKPWFNPVVDENLPELADIVSRIKGDAALRSINIR